jgi:hypothetical protein
VSTPFPRSPRPLPPRSWLYRHRKGLTAIGIVLGTAVSAGYKAISDARAERTVEVPAADVSALRKDISDLRDDIRDERTARGELTRQIGEFNGRIGRLEGAEAARSRK